MDLIWLIAIILVVLWILGFGFSIGGSLIHLLLVIALLVVIYRMVFYRRNTTPPL